MPIKNKAFVRQHLEKKQDSFTVKLNPEERKQLEAWKYRLQQEKDSTAIKQLAEIGSEVILDGKPLSKSLEVILNNYRKNKRLGIVTFE